MQEWYQDISMMANNYCMIIVIDWKIVQTSSFGVTHLRKAGFISNNIFISVKMGAYTN